VNPTYTPPNSPLDSIAPQLTDRERSFLERQLRSTRRYAVFTVVDLVVAAGLTTWWLFDGFGGTRFALIVLVLLHARANLKQHKDTKLMAKLLPSTTRRI
jgi:hypothetical protein